MPLKLFEFLEQLILGTFLMKLTHFDNNGSTGKFFFYFAYLVFFNLKVFRDLLSFAVP